MKIINRTELKNDYLPGRIIQKAVGKDGPSISSKMSVGIAHFSVEVGTMEPHHHAEEVCYILDAKNGWFRYGPGPDKLGDPIPLEAGMFLHNPPLEWHVFEFGEGGHISLLYMYGQVDNIRPEENNN